MDRCDCIIPFYNEGKKPLNVIESILKVKLISKIIVVDDGSNDKSTYQEITKKYPSIKVIRLDKNTGKANAVYEGLKQVNSEYVFLIDSDLNNVNPGEIEDTIEKIISKPKADMIILALIPDIMNDWFRLYTIFSGQRILRTSDLEEVYKKMPRGFQIEAAINHYMINNHKKVYWMQSSIRNFNKYRKWGITGGLIKVIDMFKEIFHYISLKDFLYQILFFSKTKIPIE